MGCLFLCRWENRGPEHAENRPKAKVLSGSHWLPVADLQHDRDIPIREAATQLHLQVCLLFCTHSLSSAWIRIHCGMLTRKNIPTMPHTIPLLAATCLMGFVMLQFLFSTGSW
jgi:hypothetical protein